MGIDYKEIIKKENKSIKLLEDYFSISTLFKNGGTKEYHIGDISKNELLSFLNKFYLYENDDFKSYDKNKKLEFIEYFELKDNETYLYNTVICLIDNLLTIIKLKEEKKGFKNTKLNFNDKTFDIQFVKKYHTYYFVIDNRYPIFFTNKEKCLGNISISNNKFWFSYLNSTIEYYLNIAKWSDNKRFIETILYSID